MIVTQWCDVDVIPTTNGFMNGLSSRINICALLELMLLMMHVTALSFFLDRLAAWKGLTTEMVFITTKPKATKVELRVGINVDK